MISVAVDKVWGICPAGDLSELRLKLKNNELFPKDFRGQCNPSHLSGLAAMLPGVSLRRVPQLARLALRVALEVLPQQPPQSQQQSQQQPQQQPQPQALVVSTAYGSVAETFNFLDSMLSDGPAMASPTAFSHSVTNMTAAYISQCLKITGPSLTVTQQSFIPALKAAAVLVDSCQVDSVLLGAVSEFSNDMNKIENSIAAIENSIFPQPLNTGEGAVFYLIRRPSADKEEVRISISDFEPPTTMNSIKPDNLGEIFGSSNLALGLRLAIACCDVANGSVLQTRLSCVNQGHDLIIEKSGEAA